MSEPEPAFLSTAERERLARAELAMAEGCPSVEQELLLMAAGSTAHRARRHPSIRHPSIRHRGRHRTGPRFLTALAVAAALLLFVAALLQAVAPG
ncbi:hypothetical protein [Kutzneria albida]|uniref:DUF3040 domain-containing protein n=1 Tax=Kutzneria albida DSM 43870 TaxID=1449976 RepID=W5WBA8_9PSEU|nr:hypothetical protein [Kutzneria albida]AHH98065.1 hypothetical protein KALB_4703 [Kutzneria albida DSM 43870]